MKDEDLILELKKHFNIPDSEDLKISYLLINGVYDFTVESENEEFDEYTGTYFYIIKENRFIRPFIN